MTDYMFSVPFHHFKVDKWEKKKIKLLNLYNQVLDECDYGNETNLITNYHQKSYKTTDGIYEVFYEEIEKFLQKINGKTCNLKYSWFENAKQKGCHGIHNHGPLGYSSVCFINYNETEHTPTKFIAPFNNFITGLTLLYTPQNISEGSIIFFPSVISHFTDPNFSEEERLIVSFNLDIE